LYGFDPVILIDTHTHLYLREFNDDRDKVVTSALAKGVQKMLLPNVDGRTIEAMHSLADTYPDHCLPMIGLHPTSVDENYQDEINQIRQLLDQRKYWGIGETGIDLYWDKTFALQQEESFREHIKLAKETGLPLIIHARNSFPELFRIMDEENDESLRGIFHAFTGNQDQARKIIDYGFKLGIGGILTFKNAKLDEVVREIDLMHIVLETDAPYLAPVPMRGKRNEPVYLINTAMKLAEIHDLTLEEVAETTTQNASRLFTFNI
jgi:TatD DNase family protein